MINIHRQPDALHIELDSGWFGASLRPEDIWEARGAKVHVDLQLSGKALISLESPSVRVKRIHLRWKGAFTNARILGDHWERGYGDLAWQSIVPERVLPWYTMVYEAGITHGYGVKTGAAALCFWRMDDEGISLVTDVRSGRDGVALGERILKVATVVTRSGHEHESPFTATQKFCRIMCDTPRMPSQPVYGGNNWYYAYGNSSHAEILEDTKRVADWSTSKTNRPYMVIDDGWQLRSGEGSCNGGPWVGNSKFPDMQQLAGEMTEIDVRPGIWVRPLLTTEDVSDHWVRSRINGANVLDPSVPDVLEYIRCEIGKLSRWGYQLIKHDFTSFDILDQWGFELGADVPMKSTTFRDGSKTTAEIILDLYKTITEASEESIIIGCNTIGHLGAGLFELQRTGDDTSGREWERTRKMGINTLAFRMPQHGTFFSADADCVGLTNDVPWYLNQQWLQLLAESGTPLFISADPKAVGSAQEQAIRQAFEVASQSLPIAEPLDWMETTCPSRWLLNGRETRFDWFGDHGVVPSYGGQ